MCLSGGGLGIWLGFACFDSIFQKSTYFEILSHIDPLLVYLSIFS